jgi:glycosyltransferase involved in cell wall biosynthesis
MPVSQPDPIVSAIVSTYNSERFFRGCLEDLVAQTLGDRLEILVIDSGSQENEGAIAREFQARHPNVRYVRTEREPLYKAWNRAIRMARGRYLTNANTDDRHHPLALETMARALEADPEIALVYADLLISETANAPFGPEHAVGAHQFVEYQLDYLLTGCFMGPQPMWRRSLHDELGYFDERFKSAGDYEFWCRVALVHPMRRVPEILGMYYLNPQGIEHGNKDLSRRESRRMMDDYEEWLTRNPTITRMARRNQLRLLVPVHDLARFEGLLGHYLRAVPPEAPVTLVAWIAPHLVERLPDLVERACRTAGRDPAGPFAEIEVIVSDPDRRAGRVELFEACDSLWASPDLDPELVAEAGRYGLSILADPGAFPSLTSGWDPAATDLVVVADRFDESLAHGLETLGPITPEPHRLILILNEPPARPAELAWRIALAPDSSQARALGVALTRSSTVVLLDPADLGTLEPGWLSELTAPIARDPEIGLVAWRSTPTGDRRPDGLAPTSFVTGTRALHRRFYLPFDADDQRMVDGVLARGGQVLTLTVRTPAG